MNGSHRCPVFGCQTMVAGDRLACWKHWKKLPEHLKREVNVAWDRRQRGVEGGESQHLAAMAAAVEWWESQ